MPRISLIEDLTNGPIPAGSNLLVEFDAASQWYAASITIAAGWLRTSGTVSYNVYAQPPDNVRAQLARLGLGTEELERDDKLRIIDWYTATLGQKSPEKYAYDSLKVADLSIRFSKEQMRGPPLPDRLRINDNGSVTARFNDEKAWVEFMLTRGFPMSSSRKLTTILPIVKGVHSEWAYRQLEAAVEGIIDFTIEEVDEERKNFIGIRTMRNVLFDARWHPLRIGENFEVTLEK